MTDPLVVPGDDGAGIVDQVGEGVDPSRIGERVWVHSATYLGPMGTCAEYVTVPSTHATVLPDAVSFDVGACLGVPVLTAYRCLFEGQPIKGRTVLVTGGAGAVGHYAIELAKNAGANVVATASSAQKQDAARRAGADLVVNYRDPDAVSQVSSFVGTQGVDLVVDVDFAANLPLTTAVIADNGTIATYSSNSDPYPAFPFYELMRRSITIRTVLVFQAPRAELQQATAAVTALLEGGELTHPIAETFRLDHTAAAHEKVESGAVTGKVLIHV